MKKFNLKKRSISMIVALATIAATVFGNVDVNAKLSQADSTVAAPEKNYTEVKAASKLYMYDFGTSRNYGDTSFRGDNIDFEGYQGIRLDTSDGKISYAVYNHSSNTSDDDIRVDLYKVDENDRFIETLAVMSIPDGEVDSRWRTVTDDLSDGLYRINSEFLFLPDGSYDEISGYVYIENGKAMTCRVKNNSFNIDSRRFDKLLAENDTDPQKYLSNKENTYPSNGTNGSCVQIEEWEHQADEIIEEWHLENATDEAKVFFFTEWLAKNIAYDEWRVTINKNKSRATKNNDWYDDNLWAYYNGVGQCWDFVNAMAIMCRHAGIPCTDVANAGHTITCVWMNGKWSCIDITVFTRYTNWEENPDPAKYQPGEWCLKMNDYYGYYPHDMYLWEACIWEAKNNR